MKHVKLFEQFINEANEEIEDAYQTILKNIGQEKSNKLVEVKSNKSLSYE